MVGQRDDELSLFWLPALLSVAKEEMSLPRCIARASKIMADTYSCAQVATLTDTEILVCPPSLVVICFSLKRSYIGLLYRVQP